MNKIFSWFASFFSKTTPLPPRPENTGIILSPDTPTGALDPRAYVVGVSSLIPYQVRLPSGDWLPYCWSKTKQWCTCNGVYQETYMCTTCALLNAIETQEYFLTGQQLKYSRRWVAKMSGTNQGALKGVGNYMDAPAEWVRKNGLVLESSYPTPDSFTVDQFYADIDPIKANELALEGQAWLQKRSIAYEFLQVSDPNLDYHLKHAPVTVVIPGHDICGIYSPDAAMQYRDSYEPWDKSAPVSGLQAAMKVVLYDNRIAIRQIGWTDQEKGVYVGFDTPDRQQKFQQALLALFPDYRLETKEWNLGKRPWT